MLTMSAIALLHHVPGLLWSRWTPK